MALVGWNSFYYDTRGWYLPNVSQVLGAGQNSIAALRISGGTFRAAIYGHVSKTEVIYGFCIRPTDLNFGVLKRFIELNVSGTTYLSLHGDTDGAIKAIQQNNGSEYGRTATGLMAAGVETYIELRVKWSTTVGEIEIRLNGSPTPALSLTGLNLLVASNNEFQFGSDSSTTIDMSAWYMLDVTGPAPLNDFLGHIRYGILNPSGNGNASEFDGSDGNSTDNYLLVDDGSSPDDATTYVSSSTLNERDTYAMGDLPTASTIIYAVCPVLRARKSDAGTRAVAAVVRRSGVDYPGDDSYLGLSWDNARTALTVDPSTAAAWTDAGVNAIELGPKVSV